MEDNQTHSSKPRESLTENQDAEKGIRRVEYEHEGKVSLLGSQPSGFQNTPGNTAVLAGSSNAPIEPEMTRIMLPSARAGGRGWWP